MKKSILFLSMILVFSVVLMACSQGSTQTVSDNGDVDGADDPLKVILLIPGTLGDKSFFDSANAGLKLIEEQLGAETKVVEMGTDSVNWEPNFYDAAEGDWDIIMSGNETTELLNRIASEYPDKRFINFDTSDPTVEDNVYSMFYSTNEVSYLAGALSALVTQSDMEDANEENIIGFIGGMDIPGINDFLLGFIQGAQSIDPDIKVLVSYAGDFNNPAKGKELALVQYNAGADIIFSVAGGTGLGVIDAAKEESKYAVGVDSDQALLFKESDPEKSERIISSAVKRIDLAIFNAVEAYVNGTLEFGTYNKMGVADGAVGLAKNEYYETLSQDIKDEIEVAESAIINGEVEVQTAFGLTSDEISEIRDSVRN